MRVWTITYCDDSHPPVMVTRSGLAHYLDTFDAAQLREIYTLPSDGRVYNHPGWGRYTITCEEFRPNPISVEDASSVIATVFRDPQIADLDHDEIHGVTSIRFTVWKFPILIGIGPRPGAVLVSDLRNETRVEHIKTLDELEKVLEDLRLYLVGVAASILRVCGKTP